LALLLANLPGPGPPPGWAGRGGPDRDRGGLATDRDEFCPLLDTRNAPPAGGTPPGAGRPGTPSHRPCAHDRRGVLPAGPRHVATGGGGGLGAAGGHQPRPPVAGAGPTRRARARGQVLQLVQRRVGHGGSANGQKPAGALPTHDLVGTRSSCFQPLAVQAVTARPSPGAYPLSRPPTRTSASGRRDEDPLLGSLERNPTRLNQTPGILNVLRVV